MADPMRGWLLVAVLGVVSPCMAADGAAVVERADVLFRKAYYDGGGGQVHFLIAQPVDAAGVRRTPLVLSHPTAQSGDYLRRFMAEMATDRVVLAPDTPGYGASDAPDGDLTMDEYAAWLAPAIRRALADLGAERADLGGNHTGAFISAALALHAPDITRRVLLSAVPYWSPGPDRERLLEDIGRDRPLPERLEGLAEPWEFHVARRNPAVSLERAFGFFVAQLRSEPHHARAFRAVFSWPAESRLPRLGQPVAVLNIAGSLDAQTRAAAALIPGARIVDVEGFTTGAWEIGAVVLAARARELLDEWDGRAD